MRRTAGRFMAPILMAAALLGAAPALAGDIADKAALAEKLVDRGYPEAALAAFDKSLDAFWAASPLQLRAIAFADAVSGHGAYEARSDAVFRNGDTLRVYFEPVGYGFATTDDTVSAEIAVDVEIRTPGGLILAEAEDFARLKWSGSRPMHEVQATVETKMPFLKPGAYLLLVTLRDINSSKTKDVTLPFSVAE